VLAVFVFRFLLALGLEVIISTSSFNIFSNSVFINHSLTKDIL
jgi:hypothetical protein